MNQFEYCSVEGEIAKNITNHFRSNESRYFSSIKQKISSLENQIKIKNLEVKWVKDLFIECMKKQEKGNQDAKR